MNKEKTQGTHHCTVPYVPRPSPLPCSESSLFSHTPTAVKLFLVGGLGKRTSAPSSRRQVPGRDPAHGPVPCCPPSSSLRRYASLPPFLPPFMVCSLSVLWTFGASPSYQAFVYAVHSVWDTLPSCSLSQLLSLELSVQTSLPQEASYGLSQVMSALRSLITQCPSQTWI